MNRYGKKKWRIANPDKSIQQRLEKELNLHPVVARLLVNRGITTKEAGENFLHARTDELLSPFTMKGVDRAVEAIEKAVEQKQPIVIYGDYDVDGITATSLLYRFLKKFAPQIRISYYIPERQSEGYGLNAEALDQLAADGAGLIITVDCGISSAAIVAAVQDRLPIIITDHHTPPEAVPEAVAVIDPKQADCPYGDKNLSGAGVAFKLCQALWLRRTGQWYLEDMDIAALGTIADIVPLTGENRIIVREGLKKMTENPNLGIQELINVAGLTGKKLTAGHIGFTLAPRLNAAGRVTHATRGVELLVTEDLSRAAALAQELQETNTGRQQIERLIHEEARQEVLAQGEAAAKVMVIAGEGWHPGVIGIVASRLVEEFYRPALMISIHDSIGKGSCRSIEGFNIYEALKYAEDLLIQFGGHNQAAGFSIEADNIPLLRERLDQYCRAKLTDEDYIPVLDIDAVLTAEAVTLPLLDDIAALEPYGMGNSTPVFALKNMVVDDVYLMGQQKTHCKLRLTSSTSESSKPDKGSANFQASRESKPQSTLEAIAWQGGEYHRQVFSGQAVDAAFTLQKNEWQGRESVQLILQDLKVLEEPPIRLTAEGLRHMYVLVKGIFRTSVVPAYIVETELIHRHPAGQTAREAMAALEVFRELGILQEELSEDGMKEYRWCHVAGKLSLDTSVTFIRYSTQENDYGRK